MTETMDEQEQIVGTAAMAARLKQLRLQVREDVEDGVAVVLVPFADGWTQILRDFGSGDWEYALCNPAGDEECGGSGDISGGAMVGSVLAYAAEHGAPGVRLTVTFTPAQLVLLRDLVHWAADDIREGLDDTFWSLIVEEDDWEDACTTMQELRTLLNPPESLAGGAAGESVR